MFDRIFDSRFWAIATKEINQILHNKQLIFLLLFPPTVQLLIFGLALSPDVSQLTLGVVDYANSYESRELVQALTANQIFQVHYQGIDQADLVGRVQRGQLTTGLIIPPDFNRQLSRGQTAQVQVFIDGVDANTAGIAQGYLRQILNHYSLSLRPNPPPPVQTQSVFFYNPGLVSSWFLVPGVMGVVLTLTSSLVSSTTLVKEKDTGTLEQLLMTPADSWEILTAKIVPLFALLMGDVVLAVVIARAVFAVPFRGSLLLYLLLAGLYVSVGIGIGLMLATVAQSQEQVVLISFFVNLPLIQTSGAIAPIESMPPLFQTLSWFNPLRHFVAIIRGILLKGVGLEVLWPNGLMLAAFAVLLMTVSITQFRRQLA
ncbi:MAG: ABC transporter permease [Leptolyngbya sp. LCM1.Bin17]|nr:MAG: ABC transporter permease [Leptolyngbya sp. LCM1.Bin17]